MVDPQSQSVCVSSAGNEPLQLDEAKTWLRVDIDDDDSLISGLCTAARQWAEKFTRLSLVTGEQWKLSLDHFPGAMLLDDASAFGQIYAEFTVPELYFARRPEHLAIELPEGPVTAITAFTYLDQTNTLQTLAPSAYNLVLDGDGTAQIYPALQSLLPGAPPLTALWPASLNYPQSVQILYTTGAVPDAAIVLAMKQVVAHWYVNRESVVMVPGVTPQNVPLAAEMLLWPYRHLEF